MKILVIGSGGREHALCWKLRQSKRVHTLFCAPGNPGIARVAELVAIGVDKLTELADFAEKQKIDVTIVGPEYPLSLGIVDVFQSRGLKIFGPSKAASQLESSKSFAKEIMTAAGVPTAAYETFTDLAATDAWLRGHPGPIVLKADGLAAGKGVFVCKDSAEALQASQSLFTEMKATKVVAEEFLDGKEASFIVAANGNAIVPLAPAHDYKRIFDGDEGPNTGGMGSVCPTNHVTSEQCAWALEHVMRPVISEMERRGIPFSGFLYGGLMI
ncbi:MAG: phosphoribosylamine--glycine ligase, partial [Deltaproteobacteria bacterium]|nr:phosphoribosylamine--glycine ligase [Deltaproteobacteria bacterium]